MIREFDKNNYKNINHNYNDINIKIEKDKKILVGYLLLGYPNSESFLKLLKKLNNTSLNILELGIPSNNPEHDGIIIQEAHKVVDHNLNKDIEYFKKIRSCWEKPIWIMGYYNDLINTNLYMKLAACNVYDALVIPDMPTSEYGKYSKILSNYNIHLVTMINPEMDIEEMNYLINDSHLIYGQLYKGKTGSSPNGDQYKVMLEQAIKYPNTKIFAGFGIKNREHVVKLWSEGFDGCIIGTEMINKLNESEEALIDYIKYIKER